MTPDQEELLFSQINRVAAQKHIDHAALFIAEAARLIGALPQRPHPVN